MTTVKKNVAERTHTPKPNLQAIDVIALIVGIVIGAGIFRIPSLVAANSASGFHFILYWIMGGTVSLVGALCYAELATTFPNTGGDYYFILRAFGRRLAFLFAWARISIIQTGSVALLAFIFGDYASQVFSLGDYSSVIYAAFTVLTLTGINILGVKAGAYTQKILTSLEVLGILVVVLAGFFFAPSPSIEVADAAPGGGGSTGLAMVFVLLTFGGWNEAAYVSAELRSGRKLIASSLIVSIVIITIIYLVINLAYLRGLGMQGMASSDAIAGDLMRLSFGEVGMVLISILVAIAALTSANATIFTGARSNYALGRDFAIFSILGKWKSPSLGPVNSLLAQGLIALVLVSMGLFSRDGFETMVEYTAPVFWFFFLLVGLALFRLRKIAPAVERPFRVPLYPFLPMLFCLTCFYLLYSSIVYTGWGAMVGIGVLLVGVMILYFNRKGIDGE
jgi:amino acid transporter